MTRLVLMREEVFARFLAETCSSYAQDNVAAGRWPETDAQLRAGQEFSRLLPDGLRTPGHQLYEILNDPTDETVGFLWFAVHDTEGLRSGYVYNIRVLPEFRGRGHATAALAIVETIAADMGLHSIGLHVFAFNSAAQALYRAVGYGITGFNMRKRLNWDEP